ncbi:MAG: tetratricopeptide repeat protein [bacterium]
MKNKLIYLVIIPYLFTTCIYANAQPISKSKENAATQELIQSQTGKQLTALDWYNRGVALNDNSDQELACYKKAIEVDPTFAPAYYNMGIIYVKRGMNQEAISSFNQFLKFSNDETKKQEVRKVIAELGGEPANQNTTQSQPLSSDLKQEAIKLYNAGAALNDNSDKEMQYYLQAIVLDPELAPAHLNLGLLYYHRKAYKDALKELTAYIEYTNDPPAKRKEVLNLIEWLKIAINTQATKPNSQQQPATPQSAPVQNTVPSPNNVNTDTKGVQEVPLK